MRVPQSVSLFVLAASIPLTTASSHAYDRLPPDQEAALLPILPFLRNPAATPGSLSSHSRPPPTRPPSLSERGIVDAPPAAQPTKVTQMSPVMTINVDGKPVLYTQKFSPVPDQLPQPKKGAIGLGTLEGEIGETSTIDKRAPAETETSTTNGEPLRLLARHSRCKTLECVRAHS
ncbi:predicted protein [Uncinocarpus reesii 1704]|uniref:Uncharacterized protein n=1 Tax=Uncinocarpus reesii (strain UAMH 1704) TaxID=336963 RepID=C4JUJ4_UNCRE|nr:uncharacterized protein UREG_04797 [Uncinocarpus reesii 1704]EEP79955.1 predicted protein [Uncinocarpus reesii 1704]